MLVRLLLAALLAALAAPALAMRARRDPPATCCRTPTLFPEGVAYDERSGRYFVSSQSNGALLTGSLRDPAARVFSRRPAPTGARARTGSTRTARGGCGWPPGSLRGVYVRTPATAR